MLEKYRNSQLLALSCTKREGKSFEEDLFSSVVR